jgi:hypothetical protein
MRLPQEILFRYSTMLLQSVGDRQLREPCPEAMLSDKSVYRSQGALGPAYEHPERLSDEDIDKYLRSFVRTEQRTRDLQRFLAAFDNKHTLAVEDRLKTLKAPTLIV